VKLKICMKSGNEHIVSSKFKNIDDFVNTAMPEYCDGKYIRNFKIYQSSATVINNRILIDNREIETIEYYEAKHEVI